jgi:hypothetical protein
LTVSPRHGLYLGSCVSTTVYRILVSRQPDNMRIGQTRIHTHSPDSVYHCTVTSPPFTGKRCIFWPLSRILTAVDGIVTSRQPDNVRTVYPYTSHALYTLVYHLAVNSTPHRTKAYTSTKFAYIAHCTPYTHNRTTGTPTPTMPTSICTTCTFRTPATGQQHPVTNQNRSK